MAEDTDNETKPKARKRMLAELTAAELAELRAKKAKRFASVLRQVSGAHPAPSTSSSARRIAVANAPAGEPRKSKKKQRRAARKENAK